MTGGMQREPDAALTSIWDVLRDGVVVVDAAGTVRYANAAAARALALGDAQVSDAPLATVAPALVAAPFAAAIDAVRCEGAAAATASGFVEPTGTWCTVDARRLGEWTVLVLVFADAVRVERQRTLTKQLGRVALGVSGFDESVRAVVSTLRDGIGYAVGEAWLRTGADRPMRLLAIDHDDRADLVRFAATTRSAVVLHDADLENVLSSTEGFYAHPDVLASAPFVRDHGPDGAGLRSGFHVAVELGGDLVLLLGFFSTGPPDDWPLVVAGLRSYLHLLLRGPWLANELERFFHLSRDLCCITDGQGVILRVNSTMEQVLGQRGDGLVGRSITELAHPDDVAAVDEAGRRMVATDGEVHQFEARFRVADGTHRWLSWNAGVSERDGLVFAAARDVTVERDERMAREARYRVLAAIVGDEPMTTVLERFVETIELQAPEAWASMALLTDDGTAIRTVVAPSATPEQVDALTRGPVPDLSRVDGRLPDGVTFTRDGGRWHLPIEGSGQEVLGVITLHVPEDVDLSSQLTHLLGGAVQLAAIAIERAQAREQLERQEERFRFVVDATSDVVFDWDLRTDTVWRSEQSSLLAIPDESVEGWATRVHPGDAERVDTAYRRAIDGTDRFFTVSYRFRRTDGSYADVTDECVVIRDSDGQGTRVIGGMSDRTEQRHRERRALQAQRMESIGQLAGGIAHDLNNTLAPVLLAVDLLRDTDLPAAAGPLVDQVDESVHRAAATVRQMLTFARGTDGERVPVSIAEVVATVAKIATDTFPKSIQVRTDVAPDLPAVPADAVQLHQVLLNLAVNARDAMEADGGVLTFAAALVAPDDRIGLATTTDPAVPLIRIDVSDTGTGITAAVRERLFEPFFTTKPTTGGTGLGLPTSAAIVERHGGSILVDSEPGRGSTFTVVLPTISATPEHEEPQPAVDAAATGALVLVVDDEVSILTITEALLRRAGYDVVTAGDAPLAVAVLAARPDVAAVVTDVMMPGMGGAELVRLIHERRPDVPVVAVTGLGDPGDLGVSNVRAVLAKPFRADTLLGALADALTDWTPEGPR